MFNKIQLLAFLFLFLETGTVLGDNLSPEVESCQKTLVNVLKKSGRCNKETNCDLEKLIPLAMKEFAIVCKVPELQKIATQMEECTDKKDVVCVTRLELEAFQYIAQTRMG